MSNNFDHETCPRCKCCSREWERCDHCGGEGVYGHDCGEDCCCCLDPEDNIPCDVCGGKGGWWMCIGGCDKDGRHEEKTK
jgi:hypothetical protein